ncbi:MAG: hypothetical protein M3N37_08375 [Actinomycetota bacterium]|nr:hypothetical protein [Actinomycetota bacterium]
MAGVAGALERTMKGQSLQSALVVDWLLGRTGLSQRLGTRRGAAVAITWVALVAVPLRLGRPTTA